MRALPLPPGPRRGSHALPLPPGPREPSSAQTLEWVLRPTALLRRCAATHGEAFTLRLRFDDAPLVLVWSLMELRELLRAVTASARLAPVTARGERMRRRGITLQPGAGARVVLR